MHRYLTMALLASAALVPVNAASAAVFTYTFYATGTGMRTTGYDANGPISSRVQGAIISFGVDVQPGSDVFFGTVDNRSLTVTSTGAGLRFFDSINTSSTYTFSGSGNACFANSGGFLPTMGAYTDPACSSLSFSQSFVTGLGGIFTGTITSFAVEAGGALGLTRASLVANVPEPSTWAMMLAGFAMTGYALRQRRARVAFA